MKPWRWTDLDGDPDGWVEIEVEVTGPRTVAELLAETGAKTRREAEKIEDHWHCPRCAAILARVQARERSRENRRHGRREGTP